MPPSDKEVRHLRLIEGGPSDPGAHSEPELRPVRGPRLVVDASLLTPSLEAHAERSRRALVAPLVAAASAVLMVGGALLVLLQPDPPDAARRATSVPSRASLQLRPRTGPSVRLVPHAVSPTTTEYSLRLHNLPGVERDAAEELAVAVLGPRGEVAWLAPAAQSEGVPWAIPHVATLELPDGPRLSEAPAGTRIVALFLRAGAKSEDIVAWAHAGAKDAVEAMGERLGPWVVHVETISL